jgi:hypothetical protein
MRYTCHAPPYPILDYNILTIAFELRLGVSIANTYRRCVELSPRRITLQ